MTLLPLRLFDIFVSAVTTEPLRAGSRYQLKHTSRNATAIVQEIEDVVDVHTLERDARWPRWPPKRETGLDVMDD